MKGVETQLPEAHGHPGTGRCWKLVSSPFVASGWCELCSWPTGAESPPLPL